MELSAKPGIPLIGLLTAFLALPAGVGGALPGTDFVGASAGTRSSPYWAIPFLPDASSIDGVLAARAPDLDRALRQRVGEAIAEEAFLAGYDPMLVLAIIDVESDFEQEAISSKGAFGLMQLKPSTLRYLAEQEGWPIPAQPARADPELCVRLGIRYLKSLHDRFGDLDLALMAYNAGPSRVRRAVRSRATGVLARYPARVRSRLNRLRGAWI